MKHSKGVLTDSGGITEEATYISVPCITLRSTTDKPETVDIGTNELVGTDTAAIASAMRRLVSGNWKKGGVPDKWDERAAERIVNALSLIAGKEAEIVIAK